MGQSIYETLAVQVSAELKKGVSFRSAISTVLRQYNINTDWDEYFSRIGEIISRKKVSQKVNQRGHDGKGKEESKKPLDSWGSRKDING